MGSENTNIELSENSKNVGNVCLESNETAASEVKKYTEIENIENTSTSNEDVCQRKNENTNTEECSVELTENVKEFLRENESEIKCSGLTTKSEIECLENVERRCEMYSNTSTLSGNEYRENNEIGGKKYSDASTVSESDCGENIECSDAPTISEKDSISLRISESVSLKNKDSSDGMHLSASTISDIEYLEKSEIIDIEKHSGRSVVKDFECFERNENIDIENYADLSMLSENKFLGINENLNPGNKDSSDNEKTEHLQNENRPEQRSVHFDIFPQFTDPVQNEISKRSINLYFCCGSLTDGAVASANYTIVLSVIFILITCHQFFRSGGDEEGTMKALCFCGICYAICYIKCGTRMKLAVEEERRDKLIPWIIFSIITIFSLLSGIVYICMNNWDELDDFHEDLTMPCLLLVLISFLILIECTLIYCTWGVVQLFKSMGFVPRYSVMDGFRMFTYGVAV